jgi:enamine deaminase RidA (YjgF/YER057c/UK114 family)
MNAAHEEDQVISPFFVASSNVPLLVTSTSFGMFIVWLISPEFVITPSMSSRPPKTCYETASPYEKKFGYYRAVRHGNQVFVSGTTSIDPYSPATAPLVLYPNDARQQTRAALQECIKAVIELGGQGLQDIVRVKMFVGCHDDCEAVGEGFYEVLGKQNRAESGKVGAAATMIVVKGGFINKQMLVEVEVDAIIGER